MAGGKKKIAYTLVYGMFETAEECIIQRPGPQENITAFCVNLLELMRLSNTFQEECTSCFNSSHSNEPDMCKPHFDGVTCWEPVPFGEDAEISCPQRQYFNNGTLRRRCLSDGEWESFGFADTIKYCLTSFSSVVYNFIVGATVVGHTISVLFIAASLMIFYKFSSLRCQRTKIHIQLFWSYLASDTSAIFWQLVQYNNLWKCEKISKGMCATIHIFHKYSAAANLFWMFSEGLYLYLVVAVVFIWNENLIRWLYVIGWGAPVIFTALWALLNIFSTTSYSNCLKDYNLVYEIPIKVTNVITVFVLVHVLYLVWKRVKTASSSRIITLMRVTRAACFLIPLLGVYYIGFAYPPSLNFQGSNTAANIYFIFELIVTTLQGFAVACIFCLTNSEVRKIVGLALTRTASKHQSYGFSMSRPSHTTQSTVASS